MIGGSTSGHAARRRQSMVLPGLGFGLAIVVAAVTLAQPGSAHPAPTSVTGTTDGSAANVDDLRWSLSPILSTPDRWTRPRALISETGQVAALWEQRIGDDTSQVMAATLESSSWSSSSQVGVMNPSVADLRTWPRSERLTTSWVGVRPPSPGEPFKTFDHLLVSRHNPLGEWESIRVTYPPILRPMPILNFVDAARLEVKTLASGATVGVIQLGDDTPGVFRWTEAERQPEIAWLVPSSWEPTAQDPRTDFSISSNGDISAFVVGQSGLEVRTLNGNSWTSPTLVQPASEFRPVRADSSGGQLQISISDTQTILAWQQMDPRYAEDYQVWSAELNESGSVAKTLLYEATRATSWTNGQPRVEMDVSPTGARCLTYPKPTYGNVEGVTGSRAGWLPPVTTDITQTRWTVIGSLTSHAYGCLHDSLWAWFNNSSASRIPQPHWDLPSGGAVSSESNSRVAISLTAGGTNQIQVAQLDRTDPPLVTPPGPVTNLTAKSLKGSVRFSWGPPNDTGGSNSVKYQWRVGRGPWLKTGKTSVTVKGGKLKPINFQVRAINESGAGLASRIAVRPR